MTDHEPHRPYAYVGGIELVGQWVGDFEVTILELHNFKQNEADDDKVKDLCDRMINTITEYKTIWRKMRNGNDNNNPRI